MCRISFQSPNIHCSCRLGTKQPRLASAQRRFGAASAHPAGSNAALSFPAAHGRRHTDVVETRLDCLLDLGTRSAAAMLCPAEPGRTWSTTVSPLPTFHEPHPISGSLRPSLSLIVPQVIVSVVGFGGERKVRWRDAVTESAQRNLTARLRLLRRSKSKPLNLLFCTSKRRMLVWL